MRPSVLIGSSIPSGVGQLRVHKALKQGFNNLYGYTSDEKGIRHHGSEEDGSVSTEDARYFLVACSAFINYLVVKADKAGIKIKK
jgi:hypothetical protein